MTKALVEELRERAYNKTGGSNAALTVAYYDQFDAGLDRRASRCRSIARAALKGDQ